MTVHKQIGLDLQLSSTHAWGICAKEMAMALIQEGVNPVILEQAGQLQLTPFEDMLLAPHAMPAVIEQNLKQEISCPVVEGGTNTFLFRERQAKYHQSYCKVTFELMPDSKVLKHNADQFKGLFTASKWADDWVKAQGIKNSLFLRESVNPMFFHKAEKQGVFKDKFVIFSGGKLEFRKGQDILVEAFKRFHQRHPDSILLYCWEGSWPELFEDLDRAGYVQGMPDKKGDRYDLQGWLIKNGLPEQALVGISKISNFNVPYVLREADVALFTNRCEGATNMVAMEAMACEIPVILSQNTGHKDISEEGAIIPLNAQNEVKPSNYWRYIQDWGESQIDEVVEQLEWVYQNRDKAQAIGQKGRDTILNYSWLDHTHDMLAFMS